MVKALNRHILAVDDQSSGEAGGVAEGFSQKIIFRQLFHFHDDAGVGLFAGQLIFIAKLSEWHAINVFNPKQWRWRFIVNCKCLLAGFAAVTMSAASFAVFDSFNAPAIGTMAVVFVLALFKILSFNC